ncbi:hypothetical protein [Streptomyces tendae]
MHTSAQTHRPHSTSGPGITPSRVPHANVGTAREVLARDGAVILTGHENTPDALVVAAAQVIGDRLRELYPQRVRTSHPGNPVHLHADSLDIVVDIGGVPHRRRHPDEDHVLVQCAQPASEGGDSFALDAYAFVDVLAGTPSSPASTSTCTAPGRTCADCRPPPGSDDTSSSPVPDAASYAARTERCRSTATPTANTSAPSSPA